MARRVVSILMLVVAVGATCPAGVRAASARLGPATLHCPHALPLTRDAPERVLAVVRAEVPRLYGKRLSRGYLIREMGEAQLLTGQARVYDEIGKSQCGATVASRSWIVFLAFPAALPSASMSAGQLYVARTARSWVIWFRYH